MAASAPFSIASLQYFPPSTFNPGNPKNKVPFSTSLELKDILVISGFINPDVGTISTKDRSLCNFIDLIFQSILIQSNIYIFF